MTTSIAFDALLASARRDGDSTVAQLLDAYRHYLRLLARMQLHRDLRSRISPSDIVQESMIAAQAAFSKFSGRTEPELLSWLRRVLATRLIDAHRFHFAQRRDVKLEVRLDAAIDQSSLRLGALVPKVEESPSRIAAHREHAIILSEAIERLPADYAEVIIQRHLEGRSFSEIAECLDRTVPSVKGVWARAMTHLRSKLGDMS